MENTTARCLVCERNNQEIPLVAVSYQDRQYWICPSHLPILIHHPEQLTGKLPGVENLEGHSH